jgi:4-alpha-glucanotransferase
MDLIRALRATTDRLLIAEDLGDIDDGVVQLVKDSGCPGMRILQFAFLGDPRSPHLPHNYCENCVAYTGTHDNNTLLGYVWEASPEERRTLFDYCGYESEDIHHCYDAILRTMFASHAFLTIFPIQDLLLYGRDTRINVPGRSDGNWSYRLTRDQLDRIDSQKYLALNRRYGRI